VNRYQSALAALLLTAAMAVPCAAQQAPSPSQVLPHENCAECFAYLEFPPPLEPESYAMRSEARLRPPGDCPPNASRPTASGNELQACRPPPPIGDRAPPVHAPAHKQGLAP
jgi:hypothetical protein